MTILCGNHLEKYSFCSILLDGEKRDTSHRELIKSDQTPYDIKPRASNIV